MVPHPTSWRSILILSSHLCLSIPSVVTWPWPVQTAHITSAVTWPWPVQAAHIPCAVTWPWHVRAAHIPSAVTWPWPVQAAHIPSAVTWPWPVQAPHIPSTKSHAPFPSLSLYQRFSPGPRQVFMFHNMVVVDGEELLAPRPTSKLEDDPLSTVRDFFNVYAGPVLPIGLVTGYRTAAWRLWTTLPESRSGAQWLQAHRVHIAMATRWSSSAKIVRYTVITWNVHVECDVTLIWILLAQFVSWMNSHFTDETVLQKIQYVYRCDCCVP